MRTASCRYRCGTKVYRFTDHIGRERQLDAAPYEGPELRADLLWYHRSKWAGWINYEYAKKGAHGKTLHLEHQCP